jgi:hypothetical protein
MSMKLTENFDYFIDELKIYELIWGNGVNWY